MSFGATLKLLRVDAGLSLRALAQRVGVSSAYLSRVENGRDPSPTPDRLTAIAGALQLPAEMLVELAHQAAPALADYIERTPAAGSLFLEVARRDLDSEQINHLRALLDREFPDPQEVAPGAPLSELIGTRLALRARCADIDSIIEKGVAMCARPGDDQLEIARRIREREALSPTVVGGGVAVPHAVIAGARRCAALVTLAEPLTGVGQDADSIELAIIVISSEPGRPHLETLAQVARLAGHGVAGEICQATSAAGALSVIRRVETA